MDCDKIITSNLNYAYNSVVIGNILRIDLPNEDIYHKDLRVILSKISVAIDGSSIKNIIFVAPTIGFKDKLTYILFECIIYSLISSFNKSVFFICKKQNTRIITEGIEGSLLEDLIFQKITNQEFANGFLKKHIDLKHYKTVIPHDCMQSYMSKIYMEIQSFLNNIRIHAEAKYNLKSTIDPGYLEKIAEIVIELASNACEHGESDCLVDIDVTPDWMLSTGEKVFAVNIAVLNFSEILLGDKLSSKIKKSTSSNDKYPLVDKYKGVEEALRYHTTRFSDVYSEEDFFNIATFQNQISGRANKATGGTGLTQLLRVLLEQTELDLSYMLTGNRGVWFWLDNIKTENGWVGFNKNKNFFTDIPDKNTLILHKLYMPGCAFNLNLILKMEE